VSRFVVDVDVMLGVLGGEIEVSHEHELLAPTLIRSQVLSELYSKVRRGEMAERFALERLDRVGKVEVRLLGDAVLRSRAWRIAAELGWETTLQAEYIALTQLQADAFVTMDAGLAGAVSGLVETVGVEALSR
jgi:predicted nucleic acid-binding protein